MLQETEQQVAPTLYTVNAARAATDEQWKALRLLGTQLHLRTNRAAERAKQFPKFAADQFIRAAIKNGKLPPPEGGWHRDMMDFEGVPQMLLGLNLLECFFETATLRCKLLSPPKGECFVTSDNPAILLNQFAAEKKSVRDYIGFAQTGFQLVLPLGPSLCAFLYDPFVYKVGNRKDELVEISAGDVDVLNSLQVQSAERCLYAHRVEEEPRVADLVRRYARHRRPDSATIKSFPQGENQELVMFTNPPPVLPRRWQFCSRVKNIRSEVGDRRDPGYTHLIQLLMDDIEKNPTGVILEDRIKKIMGALPENAPIQVLRHPRLHGVRLPESRKDWKVGV